jgi:MFS transporter, CP family, cyanate transporter
VSVLNLRMSVAALSPVLDTVQRDLGLSSTVAGLLSTVPVVCFGLFALATPKLIGRFGMERLLVLAMVVITAGIALRVLPPIAALFAGTAVLGAGIAVGNVLVPSIIKQDFAGKTGLMTGLYSVMLFVGPAISAGFTVPIMHATGLGWRPTIALWGGVGVLAVVLLAPHAARRPRAARGAAGQRPKGLWKDPLAWMVTSFMGLQSLGYYSFVAWIPTLLQDRGMSAGQAGWMLSYSTFPGLAMALVTPLFIRGKPRRAAALVACSAVCCGIGYVGLASDPVPLAYLWLTFLGIGQGMSISLALGFIVARAPDVHHTAHLSTMAQSGGYLIASTGPVVLGVLYDVTGGWTVPMLALIVILVPMLIAGLGASRDRHILESGQGVTAASRRVQQALAGPAGSWPTFLPGLASRRDDHLRQDVTTGLEVMRLERRVDLAQVVDGELEGRLVGLVGSQDGVVHS